MAASNGFLANGVGGNGAAGNGGLECTYEDVAEDKPMLSTKKNVNNGSSDGGGGGHGITALINRQLQGEWLWKVAWPEMVVTSNTQ